MERNQDNILQSFQSLSISATNLDFAPGFAGSRTTDEFVATVNHYLYLHSSREVQRFQLQFSPYDAFLPDIENWIAFAVAKGVEELHLNLSMGFDHWTGKFTNESHSFKLPDCLFYCKSLTHISFSNCDFNPPSNFTGFDCLRSLSFTYVTITDNTVHRLLANCPLLNSLSLKNCPSLSLIEISATDLRLQRLTIDNCWDAWEIKITAPNLQSFIYNGEHIFGDVDAPSLVDGCICSMGAETSEPEHDYIKLLLDISHVKTLSICTASLWRVYLYEDIDAESLPIRFQNLKELQLLLAQICREDLACIYAFFRLCPSPFLEKLFIQLPRVPEYPGHNCVVIRETEEPSGVVFKHLKAMKLSNFIGCEVEMRLVRFLLERALVLETLVLVAPEKLQVMASMDVEQNDSAQEMVDMMTLREQLALLPKASLGANVVLCEYLEDDKALNPTHTAFYCDGEVLRIV